MSRQKRNIKIVLSDPNDGDREVRAAYTETVTLYAEYDDHEVHVMPDGVGFKVNFHPKGFIGKFPPLVLHYDGKELHIRGNNGQTLEWKDDGFGNLIVGLKG